MNAALLIMILFFAEDAPAVSVTPVADMNACHDLRHVAKNTFRVHNEVSDKEHVQQYFSLCVDLSTMLKNVWGPR